MSNATLYRTIITVIVILADLGTAASHMAYDVAVRKPFYDFAIPIWGDVWHLVAGLRYLPTFVLLVAVYAKRWRWWLAFAVLNWAGWQVLKIIHGKTAWGWGVWERWL